MQENTQQSEPEVSAESVTAIDDCKEENAGPPKE